MPDAPHQALANKLAPTGSWICRRCCGDAGFRFWAEPVGAVLAGDLARSGSKTCACGKADLPRRLISGPLRSPSSASQTPTPCGQKRIANGVWFDRSHALRGNAVHDALRQRTRSVGKPLPRGARKRSATITIASKLSPTVRSTRANVYSSYPRFGASQRSVTRISCCLRAL